MKDENQASNARQENVSYHCGIHRKGDLPQLRKALNEGVDAGLTVKEIKEVRSLNGISTFMNVMAVLKANEVLGRVLNNKVK